MSHPHHSSHHHEAHFNSPEILRDIVIGMSDGLTVPFALAAGLSGAVGANSVIMTAGIAEVVAGAIAMGLGGYLAARSEHDHYDRERAREHEEISEIPHVEEKEVYDIFKNYGLEHEEIAPLVKKLSSTPDVWVDFMMRFELGLERPDPARARDAAAIIGLSYVAGGLVPLAPYIFMSETRPAFFVSCVVTGLALLIFGYVKGRFSTPYPMKSAFQTLAIGGLAALAAFVIAKAVQH